MTKLLLNIFATGGEFSYGTQNVATRLIRKIEVKLLWYAVPTVRSFLLLYMDCFCCLCKLRKIDGDNYGNIAGSVFVRLSKFQNKAKRVI